MTLMDESYPNILGVVKKNLQHVVIIRKNFPLPYACGGGAARSSRPQRSATT